VNRNKLLIFLSIFLIFGITACSAVELDLPDLDLPNMEDLSLDREEQPEVIVPESETDAPAEPTSLKNTPAGLGYLQNEYIEIYKNVLPSVVSISATRTVIGNGFDNPGFPFDFGESPDEEPFEYQASAAGSGFVWDTEGHIITNNHVIEGAEIIRVIFSDGTSLKAKLVGADADSDLAVLKIDSPPANLTPIEVSDSTRAQVGQVVIAIGNPFQLEGSMTTGIISGIGRSLPISSSNGSGLYYSIPDVIQTDAAINPGNSGGVLVDINGGLIGVTSAIESPVRANSGVGYVIPSVIVSKIVPILIEDGVYQQPWIGISGQDLIPELAELMDLNPKQRGALVIDVTADSPADEAGLVGSSIEGKVDGVDVRVGGDVIIAADGIEINDFEDLVAFLARYALVDQNITLSIIRNGDPIDIELKLAARPTQAAEEEISQPEEISSDAWLGISGIDLTDGILDAMDLDSNVTGALIQAITSDSPADLAGLRGSYKSFDSGQGNIMIGGDVITAIDGKEVENMADLADRIQSYNPNDEIKITYIRNGKVDTLSVTLGKQP